MSTRTSPDEKKIDVGRGLVEVDQDFLGIETAPIGPRLERRKVDIQPLEQLDPGEPRHWCLPLPRNLGYTIRFRDGRSIRVSLSTL